jgi:soluble lytic murein transglycosylase-like protein
LRHTNQFYGTDSQAQSYITWFQNNPDYEAQTAICASYGLMQVLYTTAVQEMGWNVGQSGDNRHPASLFDPDTSLKIGTAYDARQITRWGFGSLPSPNAGSLLDYQINLATGLLYYNTGSPRNKPRPDNNYGADIVAKGYLFKPF